MDQSHTSCLVPLFTGEAAGNCAELKRLLEWMGATPQVLVLNINPVRLVAKACLFTTLTGVIRFWQFAWGYQSQQLGGGVSLDLSLGGVTLINRKIVWPASATGKSTARCPRALCCQASSEDHIHHSPALNSQPQARPLSPPSRGLRCPCGWRRTSCEPESWASGSTARLAGSRLAQGSRPRLGTSRSLDFTFWLKSSWVFRTEPPKSETRFLQG